MTCTDMLVYVAVYLITSGVILVALDGWLLLPFVLWLVLFVGMMRAMIPRLAETAQRQADARSLMTGRITDAYSNITTVKLFSTARAKPLMPKPRCANLCKPCMRRCAWPAGWISASYVLNVSLTVGTAALGLWLWSQGQVGVGAVATATAMALRLNGMSQWIMWESARLFENIGTVQDGMNTLSKPHTIVDLPDARPLVVRTAKSILITSIFFTKRASPCSTACNLTIRPGEKVGLIGRSGAGKSTIVNLLLRFYETDSGQHQHRRPKLSGNVTQESLRKQIGLVTQDTSLLHRSVRDNIALRPPDAGDGRYASRRRARPKRLVYRPILSDAQGRRRLRCARWASAV